MVKHDWFEDVKLFTEQLVRIRGISPSAEEVAVARKVLALLGEGGVDALYTACGLNAVEGDNYGRCNAYAFLRGQSPKTLVLLGHIDTVPVSDYATLEPWAFDPAELAKHRDELVASGSDKMVNHDDWMFGRGAADMKSGVAVNIALMRRLAYDASVSPLPLSVLMLATPDEENESAGVMQGVHLLLQLRERFDLDYVGVINTDYTTALYPGDPHRYVYGGTVGKLLPSFLCIGRESHAGAPFHGLDANLLAAGLISDLSMNTALCESAGDEVTAPPVTLHFSDLKTHYDVQLPFAAYFYLNVLTLTTGPSQLLQKLRLRAEEVMEQMLQRIDDMHISWLRASTPLAALHTGEARSGVVMTYTELYQEAVQRMGERQVVAELNREWQRWPAELDKRERSLRLVHHLWRVSGKQGPAIVLYYSPPYYPAVPALAGELQQAITEVMDTHPELLLQQREYFPLLSDLSYLYLDPAVDLEGLTANMPVWGDSATIQRPGSYSLPLRQIRQLNLPVFNIGSYGFGAHQRDERVLMSYTFGELPQLIYEVIARLGGEILWGDDLQTAAGRALPLSAHHPSTRSPFPLPQWRRSHRPR
jgi:arginine utilization protein RocB